MEATLLPPTGESPGWGHWRNTMRKLTTLVMLLATLAMTAPTAYAGPGCCAKKDAAKAKGCDPGKAACGAKSACGTGEFPAMLAKVGDTVMGCRMTAAKMAKESGDSIVFVVAGEEFKSEAKAMSALADASEEFIGQFVAISCVVDGKLIRCGESCDEAKKAWGESVKTASCGSKADGGDCCKKGETKTAKAGGDCCKKGKTVKANGKGCCPEAKNVIFRVAGREFKSKDEAIAAHKQVTAAIKKIQMTYRVDGEVVHCASMIDDKAKAAGKVTYCVGESKTDCPLTARVELAKARYEAAKSLSEKVVAKAL